MVDRFIDSSNMSKISKTKRKKERKNAAKRKKKNTGKKKRKKAGVNELWREKRKNTREKKDWLVDFNGISTSLGLVNSSKLEDCVNYT